MINSVSSEYAKVLFELKIDYQFIIDKLQLFIEVLKDEEIFAFFSSPVISDDEKKELLKKSLQLEKSDFLYFLYVLIDNKRINILSDIYNDFINMVDDELNIGRFIVYVARKLTDEEENKISNILKYKYKKKIVMNVVLDENLIGGIVIKYKNEIIDNSIISRLDDLKNSILIN